VIINASPHRAPMQTLDYSEPQWHPAMTASAEPFPLVQRSSESPLTDFEQQRIARMAQVILRRTLA